MKKLQLIIFSTLLLGAAAFLYASLLPAQHSSEVALAVIQEKRANNLLLGTKELTQIFSEIIYMEPFIDGTLEAPYKLEGVFPSLANSLAKKEAWKKQVKVEIAPEKGIITIKALSETQEGAENLAQALTWNLTKKAQIYYNNQTNFRIEKLEGPITSSIPTEPDILEYSYYGAAVGFGGGFLLVLLGIPASNQGRGYSRTNSGKNREAKMKVREKLQEQLGKRSKPSSSDRNHSEEDYSFERRDGGPSFKKKVKGGKEEGLEREVGFSANGVRVASKSNIPLDSKKNLVSSPSEEAEVLSEKKELPEKPLPLMAPTVPEEGIFVSPEEFTGESDPHQEEIPGKGEDVNSKLYGKSLLADQEQAELEERRKFPERFDEQGQRKESWGEDKTEFFPGFASTKLAKEKQQADRLRLKAVWKDGSYAEVVNGGGIDSEQVNLDEEEPTESEIKERLNRLLKGEMHQE